MTGISRVMVSGSFPCSLFNCKAERLRYSYFRQNPATTRPFRSMADLEGVTCTARPILFPLVKTTSGFCPGAASGLVATLVAEEARSYSPASSLGLRVTSVEGSVIEEVVGDSSSDVSEYEKLMLTS